MSKTVAVIGSGIVGETLGKGFLKYGYAVTLASRDPSKLSGWLDSVKADGIGDKASTATFEDACKNCELIVLAVGGHVALSALDVCGIDNLKGKVIIDTTNPISGGPDEGVLQFFAGVKDSLMEMLQAKVPEARFVKAFSSVGNELFVDPDFGDAGKPTMFICGNDAAAKAEVTSILETFGWEAEDMGGVKSARAIEPLCQLWCIHPMTGKGRKHAFKLLK